MKRVIIKIGEWVHQLYDSVVSCIYIVVFSRFCACRDSKRMQQELTGRKECVVLGNGPSLNTVLKEGGIERGVDKYVVNMFATSEFFKDLRPNFYCLIDPDFFRNRDNERINKMWSDLMSSLHSVDWEMTLLLPPYVKKKNVLREIDNANIRICNVNLSPVEGFKWFRHFVYRHFLGMPRAQTVLNMAIMSAINRGYETVYLYGGDHSWTRDLVVDDDNVVCYGDRHVYKPALEYIKLDYDIATLLTYYAKMFHSHVLINDYAKSIGCTIINCTKGSFIDAYKRKK